MSLSSGEIKQLADERVMKTYGRYDLALADPPYTSKAAPRLVERWLQNPFSTVLSVEHPRELMLPGKGSRRVHEDSAVTTYRSTATTPEG